MGAVHLPDDLLARNNCCRAQAGLDRGSLACQCRSRPLGTRLYRHRRHDQCCTSGPCASRHACGYDLPLARTLFRHSTCRNGRNRNFQAARRSRHAAFAAPVACHQSHRLNGRDPAGIQLSRHRRRHRPSSGRDCLSAHRRAGCPWCFPPQRGLARHYRSTWRAGCGLGDVSLRARFHRHHQRYLDCAAAGANRLHG
ncbi:hypothetical protein D3C87_1443120 [compost metagenome]